MPRKKSGRKLQLGPWIRRLGLTQRQLAKAADISEAYVTQLINDPTKEPSVTVLFVIADALGFDNPKDLYIEPPPIELSGAELALIAKQRSTK